MCIYIYFKNKIVVKCVDTNVCIYIFPVFSWDFAYQNVTFCSVFVSFSWHFVMHTFFVTVLCFPILHQKDDKTQLFYIIVIFSDFLHIFSFGNLFCTFLREFSIFCTRFGAKEQALDHGFFSSFNGSSLRILLSEISLCVIRVLHDGIIVFRSQKITI